VNSVKKKAINNRQLLVAGFLVVVVDVGIENAMNFEGILPW